LVATNINKKDFWSVTKLSKNIRFADLFCGLGAFRIGFQNAGYECVFSSDFNKNVQKVYEENFGEMPHGDITEIDPNDIPDFDVLLGGFPCQPFSISGKKLGFKDTRGTLFFNICEIIRIKKPSVVVLENVKNLVNHDKKRTLTVILNTLLELGYTVDWKLLNACEFGLPQNRERIFVVASKSRSLDFNQLKTRKSEPLREFLDQDGDFEWLSPEDFTLIDPNLVKRQENSGLIFVGYRNKNGFKRGIRPNTEHLNRVHRQPNRIYSVDGYHPTLPSQESSRRFFIYFPETKMVRKLTLRECYRIMGFPDNYKLSFADGMHTVQIGNSCAITVISQLAEQLIAQGLFDLNVSTSSTNGRHISGSINGQTRLNFG
jgi:DNA (cytosine-5)-methyltransferase 1